jgi:hypothetical protein
VLLVSLARAGWKPAPQPEPRRAYASTLAYGPIDLAGGGVLGYGGGIRAITRTAEMSEPLAGKRVGTGRVYGLLALVVLGGGLAVAGVAMFQSRTADPPPPTQGGKEPSVGGITVFATWPKDKKPDAAIVLSGQTFGHLQPCGCSRPQQGGLERRANFMTGLKGKGWAVAGFDLGDVHPARNQYGMSGIRTSPEQSKEKYRFSMIALREMGYLAVGVGKTEFEAGVLNVLGEYAMQKEQPPYTFGGGIGGNVNGRRVSREEFWPAPPGGNVPMIGMAGAFQVGEVAVGLAAVTGPTLAAEAEKADTTIAIEPEAKVLAAATALLDKHPKKPTVRFLLYQGTADEAKKVAEAFPKFDVILCQADDPEPPSLPSYHAGKNHPAGKQTMIVQVGHKGRYVGTVGIFNGANGAELKYQLVPLGEEYLTPDNAAAEKDSKVLGILEDYAAVVKARNFLGKVPQIPHPAQIQNDKLNLSYIGSQKCVGCHLAEAAVWSKSQHGHALDTLANKAKRPGLRNLDAECAVCHTVGLGYKTGFVDETKTPDLKHVGCESCHGPGSGHASNPKLASLNALQSPWKQKPTDRLPDVATMEKISKLNPVERNEFQLPLEQKRLVNVVEQMCRKCHDSENDPHFDLYKYWPMVVHGPAGAPAEQPKK